MILFNYKNKQITDTDFAEAIDHFNLTGKSVLCYSRLFSFGRIQEQEAVIRMIDVLLNAVGTKGTLSFPCYTFSGYKGEIFNPKTSRCIVGILGETSRSYPGFTRTIHPIYSCTCAGNDVDYLNQQTPYSCFGSGSFFDLFSSMDNSYVLSLGCNFNAHTLYHFYDQTYQAPGRFIKQFKAAISNQGTEEEIHFDAYVKDYGFYGKRMNCLARFDSLVTEMKLVERQQFANDWIHGIDEQIYHKIYSACLKADPLYFLFDHKDVWEDYYLRNNFTFYHGQLDSTRLEKIEREFNQIKR